MSIQAKKAQVIHTAFLTDYTNRIYSLPAPHNTLKLFLSLCPGSEIMTAIYESQPEDFNSNWFNYKFKNTGKTFVLMDKDLAFESLAVKINQYLTLWKDVISKLNFIYDKESDPFKFNSYFDQTLLTTLQQCQQRCQHVIVENFNSGSIEKAKFDVGRETFNNILL